MYVIYCHTCRATGHKYIGQTKAGIQRRWVRHVEDARGGSELLLHRAIRKHGEAAFEHEVLEDGIATQEEANAAEIRWIAALGTIAPNGYNLDMGGGVKSSHPGTREKIAASMRAHMAALTPEQRAARRPSTAAIRVLHAGRDAWINSKTHEELSAIARSRQSGVSPEDKAVACQQGWATRHAAEAAGQPSAWATRRANVAAACPSPRHQFNLLRTDT